ncbi:hypothetical protein THIOKS13580001 [Thiocapsa sp. KS1]|nr:hypothetical protein THIOKS13580001 [Thiocapsa sp. KS1]
MKWVTAEVLVLIPFRTGLKFEPENGRHILQDPEGLNPL